MRPPQWPTSTARSDEGWSAARDRRRDRVERGLCLGAVRAAGLSHVGPAAAALAAERFGAAARQIDRVEAPHEIGRDADHKAGLAVAGDPDDRDHAGADLLLAVVREALQILDLDARHDTGQQLDVADLAHAVAAGTLAAPHRELAPRIRRLALQPLAVVEEG